MTPNMRTLLITSQLTFVPCNYEEFLAGILLTASPQIVGVAFIDNLSVKQLAAAAKLWVMGARGLGRILASNALRALFGRAERLVRRHHIKPLHFSSVNSPELLEWVRANKIDLLLNARTREIFRQPILHATPLGAINVHHGLLPRERGLMCDLFALAEGAPAGFSVHVMTEKVDDGEILHRQIVSPAGCKDYADHILRGSRIEGEAVGNLLNAIATENRLPSGEPNHAGSAGVIYRKLKGTRAEIAWFKKQGVRL